MVEMCTYLRAGPDNQSPIKATGAQSSPLGQHHHPHHHPLAPPGHHANYVADFHRLDARFSPFSSRRTNIPAQAYPPPPHDLLLGSVNNNTLLPEMPPIGVNKQMSPLMTTADMLKSESYCHEMMPRYADITHSRISPHLPPHPPPISGGGAASNYAPPPPVHCGNPVESMLEQITGVNMPSLSANTGASLGESQMFPSSAGLYGNIGGLPMQHLMGGHQVHHAHPHQLLAPPALHHNHPILPPGAAMLGRPGGQLMDGVGNGQHPHQQPEIECDPRELEAFAEHFKQRRIKLSVTQADVGTALADLKLPGVGSLSQSTICRFESLTLSHNNMIALKPVLQSWLEDAERQARQTKLGIDAYGILGAFPGSIDSRKRKRTSIAAPEKRSLEAYFAIQPRPSGEKIAQISEKLDLKKNVVRVWFCNQRQKQKRMKFSAVTLQQH